jgi:DNA repair protein RadC
MALLREDRLSGIPIQLRFTSAVTHYIMAIPDWPESERPREKLLKNGATNLSDAELLAIFLRTGIKGKSAVDLARELLKHFDGLTGLFAANQVIFCQVPGMGPAKYAQLQAVLEMARRALEEKLKTGDTMSSPKSVRDYLRLSLEGKKHEIFIGIFLDSQNRTIAAEELFNGTLTQTSVYPREVVKRALHHNAAAIIFAHNHPSGVAEPSQADEVLTQSLKQALALVDVKVLDHFIIGGGTAMSFAERGLI